jgi:hypothetical protein
VPKDRKIVICEKCGERFDYIPLKCPNCGEIISAQMSVIERRRVERLLYPNDKARIFVISSYFLVFALLVFPILFLKTGDTKNVELNEILSSFLVFLVPLSCAGLNAISEKKDKISVYLHLMLFVQYLLIIFAELSFFFFATLVPLMLAPAPILSALMIDIYCISYGINIKKLSRLWAISLVMLLLIYPLILFYWLLVFLTPNFKT